MLDNIRDYARDFAMLAVAIAPILYFLFAR